MKKRTKKPIEVAQVTTPIVIPICAKCGGPHPTETFHNPEPT